MSKTATVVIGLIIVVLLAVLLWLIVGTDGVAGAYPAPYPMTEKYEAVMYDLAVNKEYMPMIFKNYPKPTPTPTLVPTKTSTPRPTEVPPTPTPTYVVAEGGNSCVYALGAGRNSDGSTSMALLLPSVCSYPVIHDVQLDGQLVVVRAERIKTDTYGCMEGDFGPLVTWPPIDGDCPPPPEDQLFDEWGRILWGDLDVFTLPNSYKIVCGYCAECEPPYTTNCVNVYIPKD